MEYLKDLPTAQEQCLRVKSNERELMSKIAQDITELIKNAVERRSTCVDYYVDVIPPQLQKELTDKGYEIDPVNDGVSQPYTRIYWDNPK